jgi:CheY-like chemotaxis protein
VAVDDDRLVLTNTIAMLEDLGHTGFAASSGKEALDILRQQGPVDVVITDYAMPYMTGLQLADAIKKEWPELPVIIATGFAEMAPDAKWPQPKLAKPFTEAELARELERIVRRGRDDGRVLKFAPARTPPAKST